jgi:ComF family protein
VGVLDLLLPPACTGCRRPGSLLCRTCRGQFEAPADPRDRFVASDAGIAIGSSLVLAVGALAYRGPLRRSLAQLKYEGVHRVAPMLAAEVAPALGRLLSVTGTAVLVPVPVHLDRLRSRGYNQAALLSRALARGSGLMHADPLERVRQTAQQHRLNRSARLANLRAAFSIRPGAVVPEVVILIDDIITTTATLEACAEVLMHGGAQAVYGFGIAREV